MKKAKIFTQNGDGIATIECDSMIPPYQESQVIQLVKDGRLICSLPICCIVILEEQ